MSQQDTFVFEIQGMDCPSCARSLESGVAQLDGVSGCNLSFSTAKLHVTGVVSSSDIVARVRELGYNVADSKAAPNQTHEQLRPSNFIRFLWQRLDTRLALLGAVLIMPGIILGEFLGIDHPLVNLSAVLALLVAGGPIARSGWRSLWISREVTINALMILAAVGAVFIGAYVEAGTVIVLFAIGEALEGYSASRSRDAIRSLMQLAPREATRRETHDGQVIERHVPIEDLRIGDIIVVKPGEHIPMDGQVITGASAVNQAPITGESRLIEKTVGAEVFASSVNGEGSLEIEVTRRAEDTTISRLIALVEEAQEQRAPAQRFIDRFAAYYTPAVVGLAALVAIVPPLFFGQPFLNPTPDTFGWLYRALALLVVACPCALVISTPVSIISAISNAARNGVLIKGGVHLETLSRVRAMAFDKTGTLTLGQPTVVEVRSTTCTPTGDDPRCADCDDLVALASAVERRSEHPLAYAIVAEAQRRGVAQRYPAAEMVTALAGQGVRGQVADRPVLIGSHRYFEDAVPHTAEHCAFADTAAARGHTSMMVGVDGAYRGAITVADTVRSSGRSALAQLKRDGIAALVMLTGDNQSAAQKVADAVGVTEMHSDLLPADKVDAVKALRDRYGVVAMVGDGINDTPALATADVGIAVGGASGGVAQAMETADITLMNDDLRRLPFVLRVSRAAMGTIQANVIFSIGVKLAFVGLALFGLGTMWMAVLVDVGASVLVTLNGMRLLRHPGAPVVEDA